MCAQWRGFIDLLERHHLVKVVDRLAQVLERLPLPVSMIVILHLNLLYKYNMYNYYDNVQPQTNVVQLHLHDVHVPLPVHLHVV